MQEQPAQEAGGRLRRQLVAYFTTTFAISWSVFGPTLSAVIVTAAFHGKSGLTRFFGRFETAKGLQWFLPLLAFFLVIGFGGGYIGSVVAGIEFSARFWGWAWVAQVMMAQILIAGFGEELGWRGFALQRLQQLTTPLKATLVIAAFHLLWHAPTYWLGQGMHNVPAVWAVFFLVPWSILFTWAYNRSGGSILVSVFFHATSGASLSYAAFLPGENVIPISPDLVTMTWLPDGLMGPYLGVAVLYWALALFVLRGGFGGLGTPPAFEHPLNRSE